jgi:hypothetical protein
VFAVFAVCSSSLDCVEKGVRDETSFVMKGKKQSKKKERGALKKYSSFIDRLSLTLVVSVNSSS